VPIVRQNTPQWTALIEPFDIERKITPDLYLPDVEDIVSNALAGAAQFVEATFPRDSSALSAIANQVGTASVLSNVGFPTTGGIFGGVVNLLDLVPDEMETRFYELYDDAIAAGQTASDVWSGIEILAPDIAGALEDVFQNLTGPAMRAIGGVTAAVGSFVPILGWAVQAVSMFARLGTAWADKHRRPNELEVFSPVQFSPQMDGMLANEILYLMKERTGAGAGRVDWTQMFMPIGATVGDWEPITPSAKTRDTGEDIPRGRLDTGQAYMAGVVSKGGNVGMIPNGMIDRGWELSKDGRLASGTRRIGSLFPTGSDLGLKAWSMVTKPGSPAMFAVYPQLVKNSWINYLFDLRAKLEGWTVLSDEGKRRFINEVAMPWYGWSRYPNGEGNNAREVAHGSGSRLVDKDKSFGLSKCNPVRATENLYQLQLGSIDQTDVCAYVDRGFAALRDTNLRNKWDANRRALLQHPIRCRVDVNSIPDADYRNEMIERQKTCGMMITARPSPLVSNAANLPAVDQNTVIPRAEIISVDAIRGGGGGMGILIAAAFLGLIVSKRK
jgi:hypothetical protein